jgi:hypothetical protein
MECQGLETSLPRENCDENGGLARSKADLAKQSGALGTWTLKLGIAPHRDVSTAITNVPTGYPIAGIHQFEFCPLDAIGTSDRSGPVGATEVWLHSTHFRHQSCPRMNFQTLAEHRTIEEEVSDPISPPRASAVEEMQPTTKQPELRIARPPPFGCYRDMTSLGGSFSILSPSRAFGRAPAHGQADVPRPVCAVKGKNSIHVFHLPSASGADIAACLLTGGCTKEVLDRMFQISLVVLGGIPERTAGYLAVQIRSFHWGKWSLWES